ncbi:MAG: DUF2306 domain-containing protein [Gammaproteobacteria bacterium]
MNTTFSFGDGSKAKPTKPGQAERTTGEATGEAASHRLPTDDRLFRWIGHYFYFAALVGLGIFGTYIVLRGTGATFKNFDQWHDLVSGLPMRTSADWIANLGIGMHFVMGFVLVLAWPILLSSRIRVRHRAVHRWTGRVYVTAGFLAGIGGLSFILAHHTGEAAHTAFAIWGGVMMLSSAMAYVHARAKRFDLHRAWAIRLFAMVLGSWVFDLEYRAWEDLTGGVGMGSYSAPNLFDYAILYLFFVPNLLVAEYFIRNKHKRVALPRAMKWPALGALAIAGLVFVYAIVAVSGTHAGKYGRHLLGIITG